MEANNKNRTDVVTVYEVKTKRDMRDFAKYPIELYRDCPYYVPSLRDDEMNILNPKKNFSLAECDCKCFLAKKGNSVVGRIAAIINRTDNEITGQKNIRFSRFECIDDMEVFKALLRVVAEFGKESGMETMHGPWGFNDTDREGMLTFGFDQRSTYSTNYYYPYFSQNMRTLGFADESKWIEKRFKIPDQPYDRVTALAERLKNRLKVTDVAETLSVKKILSQYGNEFFVTMNDAYGKLDGYIPVVGKAQDNVLKQFATIVNTRYLSVLVNEQGQVAAFGVVLPSICEALKKHRGKLFPTGFISVVRSIKNPKELEMALIGVRHEYLNTGINSIVIAGIMKNVVSDGIQNIESNPMLETNYSIQQQWKFAESEVVKKRQTYKMPIDTALEVLK